MSPRQSLTIQLNLVVNAEKAALLKGDPGFLAPDGEFGLPVSGIEQRGELLAWSLARLAIDEIGDSLGAYIVDARVVVGDVTPDDLSEF